MKKVLLSLAATSMLVAGQAQVLDYGFEEDFPGKDQTNWEEFSESSLNWQAEGGRTGAYSLGVTTVGTANRWERVAAFKGLVMDANKSYRVSLWVKGTGTINVALMQGDWNADMPLLAGNGDTYVQQVYDATVNSPAAYERISFVYWHPTEEIQNQFYANFHTDTEKAPGEFLRLAFTGEGQYSVDDILIEESTVQSIVGSATALRVKFGYATNADQLAAEAGGTAILDNSCVSVKLDGEEAEIESVELKSDGNLYIFLTEDYYISDETEAIAVSFVNPGDLLYTTSTAPESWDNPGAAVYGFEGEVGYYDADFVAESVAYEEAELISSSPEHESFELPNDIDTFTFTFNKAVWADSPENGKPTAVLSGAGITESLEVEAFEGTQPTLTFHRPAGSAALPKGTYTITVDNVANEKDVATTTPFSITIEVGKVTIAETTYTEQVSVLFPDAIDNEVPAGWIINNEGETRVAGTSYGSGPRTFTWTNSTVAKAFMYRTTSAEGIGTATYGEAEGYGLTIPAGDVELRAIMGAWDAGGFNVEVSIIDADDQSVVASQKFLMSAVVGNTRSNQEFQIEKLRFTSDGGNYIFKAQVLGDGGYDQAVLGGFRVYTYTETSGEKADAEVVFADDFTSYANNTAPTAESGWTAYYGGDARNAGQDYNYNGSRVFTGLAAKNLPAGYYENGNYGGNGADNPSNYIIYGENTEVGALHLDNQKYQFTYFGVGWNSTERTLYFQLINDEGEVVVSRADELNANMGSNRANGIEAVKVQFSFTPAAGDYRIKMWTNNEAIFGNIKIETVGSLAVQYRNLLKDARDVAQEELTTALSDDLFAGVTRDALAQAIADYTDPDFHTTLEYVAAIAQLDDLTKAMATRRAGITSYAQALQQLTELVEACTGTKYEGLDAYVTGQQLITNYGEVASYTLEDSELTSAVEAIETTYDLLNNMVNTAVSLLTQQAVDLAAIVATYDESLADNDVVIAAGNAISDDQALVAMLKDMATYTIYKKIADGYDFTIYDPEYNLSVADSIAVSAFIQNASFYCTSQDYTAVPANYPGWDITLNAGSLASGWSPSWDVYNGTATNPVVNGAVKNNWGTTDIDIAQTVAIPVGTYTYTLGACDRSNATWTDGANVFTEPTKTQAYFGADTVLVDLSTMGQYYSESTSTMMGLKAAPADAALTSSVTLGGRLQTVSGYGFIDNARLYLTAKDAAFDYAAAAATLKDQIATYTGIEAPARTEAPAAVTFYDLNGQRVSAAQGVCIKVERYANGYTVVKKVIVK